MKSWKHQTYYARELHNISKRGGFKEFTKKDINHRRVFEKFIVNAFLKYWKILKSIFFFKFSVNRVIYKGWDVEKDERLHSKAQRYNY